MGKVMNLTYASSLTDIQTVNDSFDSGVLRICYTGANRNGSYISKESIERNVKSLYNCPIVCNYDRETDSLGGHDVEVVRYNDGSMNLVNLTQPVGVIPESSKVWFQNFTEDDGSDHEYLCANVILWKRQEAYSKIKRDGITKHSMEITVKSGHDEDGLYHIDDFEFTAFALIGCEPCFESSALEVFSLESVKEQFAEMMSEFKESFNLVIAPEGDDDNSAGEGGEETLEETNINETNKPEPDFALIGNICEEARRALSEEKDSYGWERYCFADLDMENSMVYAWDCDDGLLYGFTYSMDGDAITIDYNSKKRMKYIITDFDGVEQGSPIGSAYAAIKAKANSAGEFESKFNDASASLASANAELAELREFKKDVEAKDAQGQRDAVFEQFTDLNGIEEFEELRANCAELDVDTLEEKCFAIRGKNAANLKFTADNKVPKLKIDRVEPKADEPYGGLFEKYRK